MRRKSCGIIPTHKKENKYYFLLTKHNTGHWSFPKGTKIKGETDLQTAKRELEEETGIKDCKILGNVNFIEKYSFEEDGEKVNKTVKYFIGFVKNPKVKILYPSHFKKRKKRLGLDKKQKKCYN